MLSPGGLARLFQTCAAGDRPAGLRDAALLALLHGVGLQRSELIHLDLGDYDPTMGTLIMPFVPRTNATA
jgi:site-specific recombinase XerD